MSIFKDYSIEDVLFDFPCVIDNSLKLYPVKVVDYKRFSIVSRYLAVGKNHLGIENDGDILKCIMSIAMHELSNGDESKVDISFYKVVNELEELFSILTREEVYFKQNVSEKIIFTSKDSKVVISEYNYPILREVAMKQNLIHEPKVYKNKIVAEWADRVKRARQKNQSNTELYDIINMVRVGLNVSYKDIQEMNIFQLYSDFMRLAHIESYKTSILFKTVSDKVPNVDYQKSVINELLKNPDDDLFKDYSKGKLGDML